MSGVLNDCDALLQAALTRFVDPDDALFAAIAAAQAAAATDAAGKAEAARAAAVSASATYAQAQAGLATINAAAYADGKVTAEEARAIADATAKAESARVAAVNAASADATAKAEASRLAAIAAAATDANTKATAARIAAEAAAATYAQAQAGLAATNAAAYADGKVSAEEARAIADATTKANSARAAAESTAAADATAKANAARTAAEGAAAIYAQAQAGLAATNAAAYADGIVTAAEARAIADATAKANAAQAAAINAAAADATAKANVAKAAADTANQAVADMARDDLLSPAEKHAENLRWNTIVGEQPGIDAAAAALGIAAERASYSSAYNTLNSYITGFGAAFTTIPGAAISIVGATYRANFKNYFDAKQSLLNAIAAKSATVAQWSGVGGLGKPADNASSDVTLAVAGSVVLTGNRAVKAGGTGAWDSSVTSKDSFVGGAFASIRIDSMSDLLFGLNSDPLTDTNWASIDYAMELRTAGGLYVWENGSQRASQVGSYAVGDTISVIYDGSAVRYCRNGVVQYVSNVPTPISAPLFFDSSFGAGAATLSNIRIGPLSSNNWNDMGGSGKPQNNATNGAPTGSLVAGVPAETVASQAGNAVAAKPAFALNAYFDGEVSGSANSTLGATFSVNPTGYTGSYSVRWVLNRLSGGPSSQGPFLSSASGNTVGVSASANIGRINYEVSVIVTHSGGLTASASGAASFVFGSA